MSSSHATAHALALVRILAGLLAASHGVRKLIKGPVAAIGGSISKEGLPYADWLAWGVTFGELAGVMLAAGVLTRIAGGAVAATMAAIVFFVQSAKLTEIGTGAGVAVEYPLLLGAVALFFVVAGPGVWALDRR